MKIEIDIDKKELQEQITLIVAKKFFESYSAEKRLVTKAVEKCIKSVIDAERERIVNAAIEKAAGKISYGAVPKLLKKLEEGAINE